MAVLTREGRDEEVMVWDRFVRIFHWGTVGLVATAFFTDANRPVHDTAGYIILSLVMARLAWGVIGSRYARFSDFLARPASVVRYLRDLRAGRARRYVGHNPAGGVMIVALLAALLLSAGSGWLSETDAYFGIAWVSHLHHWSAHLLLVLAAVHLVGVIVSSRLHGENLVAAMITGRKRADLADDATAAEAQAEGGAAAGPVNDNGRASMRGRNLRDNRQPETSPG